MRVIQLKEARVEQETNGFFFISRFGNKYGPYVDAFEAINKGNIDSAEDLKAWLPPVGTAPRFIPTRKDTTNE